MHPGRLLFKIYLGSVLAVVVAFALSFGFLATFRSARQQELSHLTEYLATELALRRHDADALNAEVQRLKRYDRVQLSLYDLTGHLIASTVTPPLPMVPESVVGRLRREQHVPWGAWLFAHALKEQGQLATVAVVHYGAPALDRVLLPVGILLFLLMVVAVVFARHLAIPLSRIAGAAQRFGRGELAARAGIRRNDEIGAVGQAFDEMADRVTLLMTSQQELLANVSHELRTPMSRIHVAVDLLIDGISDEAKELLPEIAHDLAELERLVDDVMTLARLDLSRSLARSADSGERGSGTPLRLAPTPMAELLDKAIARFRNQQKTHALCTQLQSELPTLHADAVLLRRVIENLLDNARKYSEPGNPITLSAQRHGGDLLIMVTDLGIGLDEADLKQLFTPFFRSDKSRSRATGGVGLGLVLARRVVEAHGGTIEIKSMPGHGTTVTLTLPAPAL